MSSSRRRNRYSKVSVCRSVRLAASCFLALIYSMQKRSSNQYSLRPSGSECKVLGGQGSCKEVGY